MKFSITLPHQPITDLLKYGFLTGSRVMGCSAEKSDWDIVISVVHKQQVIDLIHKYSLDETPSEYFSGRMYTLPEGKINLIFVHPHEYRAWYYATKALASILPESGISEKSARIVLFEAMMNHLRRELPIICNANERDAENTKLACIGIARWSDSFFETFGDSLEYSYDID